MRDQELTQITATGFTYDFAYDALGRCVKRTVNNADNYLLLLRRGEADSGIQRQTMPWLALTCMAKGSTKSSSAARTVQTTNGTGIS